MDDQAVGGIEYSGSGDPFQGGFCFVFVAAELEGQEEDQAVG